MKTLTAFAMSFLLSTSVFSMESAEIALEANSLKLEYYETTQRGIIRLQGCSHCEKEFYDFDGQPIILKSNKAISFEAFQQDFWNAKYPTIIIDKTYHKVIKVIY